MEWFFSLGPPPVGPDLHSHSTPRMGHRPRHERPGSHPDPTTVRTRPATRSPRTLIASPMGPHTPARRSRASADTMQPRPPGHRPSSSSPRPRSALPSTGPGLRGLELARQMCPMLAHAFTNTQTRCSSIPMPNGQERVPESEPGPHHDARYCGRGVPRPQTRSQAPERPLGRGP